MELAQTIQSAANLSLNGAILVPFGAIIGLAGLFLASLKGAFDAR